MARQGGAAAAGNEASVIDAFVRILGPVTAQVDGHDRPITARRQRAVLAYLALHAGSAVSTDQLLDAIWGDDLQKMGVEAVALQIARLRSALEPDRDGESRLITTAAAGYVLEIERDAVDAHRMERLVRESRDALANAPDRSERLADEALALWQGRPFADLGEERFVDQETSRLEQLRTRARRTHIEARMAQGRHDDVVVELSSMITDFPLDESLVRLHVTALDQLGRTTDALATLGELRTRLGYALGVEPGRDLIQLEGQLLARQHVGTGDAAQLRDRDDEAVPSASTLERERHDPPILTFLFTDIEGSTSRWEEAPDAMRAALIKHDAVLQSAIEQHHGNLFKHTGDGIAAVFTDPQDAVAAATQAQRELELPVRMGIGAGPAEPRGDDYFGPAVNRAARVMSAGHGGQILVSASAADSIAKLDFIDLGEHQLRDLPEPTHLFQVRAEGLETSFRPLKTLNIETGNLPIQPTSFLGRRDDVRQVTELVRTHPIVTLTGIGGVGKTRLSIQVAARMVNEFPDGVWFIDLASVRDAESVPDVIAGTLALTASAGQTVADSVVAAIAGRKMLLVLDNCEHVLESAATMVEKILAATSTVSLMATSREGLRVIAEQLWPVAPFGVQRGAESQAFELFVERALAVSPDFTVDDPADAEAVIEICTRLDGLALAIELAAARMVSMTPQEVRERLDDRFRLLGGTDRRDEHHSTLRRTVEWSFELLDAADRDVLVRCGVFADGFDLRSATAVCSDAAADEFDVLDSLDSLVRKSLLTTERALGRTRYDMLETIREFSDAQIESEGNRNDVMDRFAAHFAEQSAAQLKVWDGPDQKDALGWADTEFANLRSAYRWAYGRGHIERAAAIVAQTSMLTHPLHQYEPIAWAEEILDAATEADIAQLPRVLNAASLCGLTGRPEDAIVFAERAAELDVDPRYDGFEPGWTQFWLGIAHRYSGHVEQMLEISAELYAQDGVAHLIGASGLLAVLPGLGRAEEARALADDAVRVAREHGNPFWIAFTQTGHARAHADSDPAGALTTLRQTLEYSTANRLVYFEAIVAREIANHETLRGSLVQSLEMFDTALESQHRSGNRGSIATTLCDIAVLFHRMDRSESAAVVYGISTNFAGHERRHQVEGGADEVVDVDDMLARIGERLDASTVDDLITRGATMQFDESIDYVRREIRLSQTIAQRA